MAPVINRNNYANQRDSYLRFVSTALLALKNVQNGDDAYKDICVFIYLTLLEIQKSIQKTIQPWEKRGYYVKADQFCAEWQWLEPVLASIGNKIKQQDWKSLANDLKTVKEICMGISPYQRMQVQDPWRGAWKKWENKSKAAGS